MSNDKISKKNIWKNFTSFGVLISIIFCVFFFNIKIGFTVFENIGTMPSITIIIFILVFIVVIVVLAISAIIYCLRRNRRKEQEKKEDEY